MTSLLSTELMSPNLYSRLSWTSPSRWGLSESLQTTTLLPCFETMRISIWLVWHFLAWYISFWPMCNCFFSELCSVIIPLAHIKHFYKKPPNQKHYRIYCMYVVGDMVSYISQRPFHTDPWEKCFSALKTKNSWASLELLFCFHLVVIVSHASLFS